MNRTISHTKEFYEKKKIYIEKTTKICIKCGVEKNKDQYTTDRKHRDGKHPICFECAKIKQRKLYEKQPKRFYATYLRAKQKYPDKVRARGKLAYAIKKGKIKKKNVCEKCGAFGVRIEGHHYLGYEFPLDVIWLCSPCHKKEDMII